MSKKLFIAIGILLNMVIFAIVINYELNKVIDKINTPLLRDDSFHGSHTPHSTNADNKSDSAGNDNQELKGNNNTPDSGRSTPPSQTEILNSIQNRVNKPIEKADLLKAGAIIMRKLDTEEINFLYHVGTKSNPTTEEITQAKKILTSKLTAEERDTLYKMGLKYGKNLTFLQE